MPQQSDPKFDAVSALAQGAREHQEDAVVADFPLGSDMGVIVLSDGMGGHAAGDVASKIVMTEVFSELKLQSGDPEALRRALPQVLHGAAEAANECIAAHIAEHPGSEGMGATLVAAVLDGGRLSWVSVGDSPLLLWRGGKLTQLNEDHSMGPQIDFMVAEGLMDRDVALEHPDRNCLTSVLGGDEIPRIDCPADPFQLQDGDIIVAASDGLQFLESWEIEAILAEYGGEPSQLIATALLDEIERLDDPDQDNVSIAVVKVALPTAKVQKLDSARVATRPLDAPAGRPVQPRRVNTRVIRMDGSR